MISVFAFLKINNKNGVSTFCQNLYSVFGDKVNFISLYKSNDILHSNEKCINLPNNIIFKTLNWLFKYNISAFLFSRYIPSGTKVLIVNAPSMIKYINPNIKIIAVQHHKIDTLISNKANFKNSKSFIEFFSKRIDKFVVLSEKDKTEAIEKLKLSESQVAVIPHMVKMAKSKPSAVCTKKLVMLARLDNKQKRFDLVLKAMRQCTEWTLDIYGDGKDRAYISGLIKKFDLKNVNLHPATNDIESVLEKSDVHVMTSDYEGFGFSNIEAMRKGLPIIIRDTFPVAETLIKGNGVLLSKEWSETEFLQSLDYIHENYVSLSRKSVELSDGFSAFSISKKWELVLQDVGVGFDK